jgi:hypothetical protein
MACHTAYELPRQRVKVATDYLLLILAPYAPDLLLADAAQLRRLRAGAAADVGLLMRHDAGVVKGADDLVALRVIRDAAYAGRLK